MSLSLSCRLTSACSTLARATYNHSTQPKETNKAPLLAQMEDMTSNGWPTRRHVLGMRAIFIGIAGGAISAIYHSVLDFVLEVTWEGAGPLITSALGLSDAPWMYFPSPCPTHSTHALPLHPLRTLPQPCAVSVCALAGSSSSHAPSGAGSPASSSTGWARPAPTSPASSKSSIWTVNYWRRSRDSVCSACSARRLRGLCLLSRLLH